jgi:hypothetical protein
LLIALRAWPLAEIERFAVESLLETLPDAERTVHATPLALFDCDRAVILGDPRSALTFLDAWERGVAADINHPSTLRLASCARGDALFALGQTAEARRLFDLAICAPAPVDRPLWRAHLGRARVAHADSDRGRALHHARIVIDGLRSSVDECGADVTRRLAAETGSFVLIELGDRATADDAFEVSATAHLARLREIDHATRHLPDLRDAAADDIAFFNECRAHAERASIGDLAQVARAIERAARTGATGLAGAADISAWIGHRSGTARICAWCGRIATPDGRWLALGELLPTLEEATHGACDSCAADLFRRMSAPS